MHELLWILGHSVQDSAGMGFLGVLIGVETYSLINEIMGLADSTGNIPLKRVLVTGLAAAASFVVPAFAADMPVKAPNYKAAAPFSWDGFYAGVHAGYGWGDFNSADPTIAGGVSVLGQLKPSGWFGGAQIGYNSQFAQHWLLGGEIDFSASDLHATGITPPIGLGVVPVSDKIDYFGTARVRFGYVVDRSLIYATGGLAWSHDKFSEIAAGTVFWNSAEYRVGWTIGGGYEYAFDAHWSAKIEYLYSDLGHYRDAVNGGVSRVNDLTMNLVRVGVNYRFGDSAPVDPSPSLPVKAYSPRFSWTGAYLGAHASYAWANVKSFNPAFLAGSASPSGWFGGFQGGYNWQFASNWVLGFETDSSFGSLSQTVATGSGFPASYKVTDLGTVRGRLGYAMDRVLVYGTGGLAYARVKFGEFGGAGTLREGLDAYRAGWAAGGGVEYAFDPNWSVKVEYLHADLGRQHLDFTPAIPTNVDLSMNTVKVGLNYHGSVLERLLGGR